MRLAIGIPCTDRVHTDFAFCLAGAVMAQTSFKSIALIKGQSSLSAAKARNQLVEGAKKVKASHLLMIDSDMTFPLDSIDRLASHGVPVVGAVYRRRTEPFELMGRRSDGIVDSPIEGLMRMDLLATGLMLIRMDVFEKLEKPWFRNDLREWEGETIIGGEDIIFCEQVNTAGLSVWCDGDLSKEVGHLCQVTLTEQGIQMSSSVEQSRRVGDSGTKTPHS